MRESCWSSVLPMLPPELRCPGWGLPDCPLDDDPSIHLQITLHLQHVAVRPSTQFP